MASVSKRILKSVGKPAVPTIASVIANDEGSLLSAKLARIAQQHGSDDPLEFLDWLRQKRRGYDRKVDGASSLMQLVDEIADYEARHPLPSEETKPCPEETPCSE